MPFDRTADGALALGREAAHSAHRIVHVSGDRAGAEVTRQLALTALDTPSIRILEGYHAVELAMQDGRVTGLFARHGMGRDARLTLFRAPAVIFATGGLGSLYAVTTNPPESRGEGVGMAARAGAVIGDAEFVQFHPTAIAIGRDPAPLATEALRGEGATLIDETGRRVMAGVHDDGELAPRDIVARALHREIAQGHRVYLDCRAAIGATFEQRFPTVYAACREGGIDPVTMPIPVAPAAHYHMGGIATDARARASLAGLWAVGECTSTGLARGQPPRLQFAAGGAGLRRARGGRCEGPHRGGAGPWNRARPATLRRHAASACAARSHDETCRPRTRPRRADRRARRH